MKINRLNRIVLNISSVNIPDPNGVDIMNITDKEDIFRIYYSLGADTITK